MQQDSNVRMVKDTYAAFSRGDIPSILNNLDPGAVFTIPGSPAVAMSGVYQGRDGVRMFFEKLAARHEYTSFEVRDLIAENDRVVALVRYEGRDRVTGRNFAAEAAMVWKFSNGKITACHEYTDTENLAASGGGTTARGAA